MEKEGKRKRATLKLCGGKGLEGAKYPEALKYSIISHNPKLHSNSNNRMENVGKGLK